MTLESKLQKPVRTGNLHKEMDDEALKLMNAHKPQWHGPAPKLDLTKPVPKGDDGKP